MLNIKRTLASLLICFCFAACPAENSDPVNGNPVDDTPIDNQEDTKVDAGDSDTSNEPTDSGVIPLNDAGANEGHDAGALPEAWFVCGEDTDCVLYEEGCCDHCNGGTLWSVNTEYLDDLMRAHPDPTQEECDGVMCTRRMCFEREAFCEEGVCADRMKTPDSNTADAGSAAAPSDAGVGNNTEGHEDAGSLGNNHQTDAGNNPSVTPIVTDGGVVSEGPQPNWFTCSLDSQCVLHEYGCCDYCAGGNLVSVHEDYLAQAEAYYTDPPIEICANMPCITLACLGEEAFCNEGTCDHRPLTFTPVEPVDAGPVIDDEDLNNDGFPDVWFTCDNASDCIDYQPGCCDYCNGGPIYVVNTAYLSALQSAEPPISSDICSNVQCSMQFCFGPNLTCIDNVCGYQD